MTRWTFAALAGAALAAALAPGRADAQVFGGGLGRQPFNPRGTPTVSPYINLSRGGNPGVNLYGIVRPQQDALLSLQQLQQQQNVLAQQQQAQYTEGMVSPAFTGHPTRFLNYSHYFPPTVVGVTPPRR
jgi:hypothetical protein